MEKDEKLRERAIKKIKKDKDIRNYFSNFISLVIGLILILFLLELPKIISFFYVDNYNGLDILYEVIYVWFLLFLLAKNYITLRKISVDN